MLLETCRGREERRNSFDGTMMFVELNNEE